MSFVIAEPELMAAAATDLATIGSTLSAAHLAAAPTAVVLPAAGDEVSVGIAQLFSAHAQDYQTLAGQAAAFHEQFVQNLTASATSYFGIDAALASLLDGLKTMVRSFGTAVEAQIVRVTGTVLMGLLTSAPESLYPALLGFILLSAVAATLLVAMIEAVTQVLTGQVALI
ncbi:PE family protein [Mycobacterium marinum]|uniref:PE family protein n=1 Tax=Mycobacterium marinum TaxID=1781 RepID=UPI0019229A57|nr:PE family protein [Mycobacterium marinum]QQW36895.1 PE family protein [Mycobacterium marinum]